MGTNTSKDIRRISFENLITEDPEKTLAKEEIIEINPLALEGEDVVKIIHADENRTNSAKNKDAVKEMENIDYVIEQPTPLQKPTTNYKLQLLDLQSKVLHCYEENARRPLQCSALVTAFSKYAKSHPVKE